jgi:hypothetical protein
MNIFLGKLKILKSKDGKTEYLKGTFQNMPVLGFYNKKDPAVIDIILDSAEIFRISKSDITPNKKLMNNSKK